MKHKIFTICAVFFFSISAVLTNAQNQVSKTGFFKSLSLDPVITLHNSSASPIECIKIHYKIDESQKQTYEFGGTLPANTSVDIALPRMNISKGLHFFDASVTTPYGESLKGKTFAEGLAFNMSPDIEVTRKTKKKDKKVEAEKKETVEKGCDCENREEFDEDISFWFNVYISDSHKLDAFASIDKGKQWYQAEWDEAAGLENDFNTAKFKDPTGRNRNYSLSISTTPISNNSIAYDSPEDESKNIDLDYFESKAYPNPFKDYVNIEYLVTEDCKIEITVCDIMGKVIETPVNSIMHGKGKYTYRYTAPNLLQGIYYCTIRCGNKTQTLKLVKE